MTLTRKFQVKLSRLFRHGYPDVSPPVSLALAFVSEREGLGKLGRAGLGERGAEKETDRQTRQTHCHTQTNGQTDRQSWTVRDRGSQDDDSASALGQAMMISIRQGHPVTRNR